VSQALGPADNKVKACAFQLASCAFRSKQPRNVHGLAFLLDTPALYLFATSLAQHLLLNICNIWSLPPWSLAGCMCFQKPGTLS